MEFNLSKFVKKVGQGIVINKGKKLMRGNVQGDGRQNSQYRVFIVQPEEQESQGDEVKQNNALLP